MELQRTEILSQNSDLWTAQPRNRLVYIDAAVLDPVMESPKVATVSVETILEALRISVTKSAEASKKTAGPSKQTKAASKAHLIVDEIHRVVADAGRTPETTPRPTDETMSKVISVVSTVPDSLLGEPDVDTLYGEINLTWNDDAKQVILICCPDGDPLIHHHQHIKGKPSRHGIEKATAKKLAHWLGWLHE
jgi:hypothetical protein